jgi:CRISPR system Cascade subunit CasC
MFVELHLLQNFAPSNLNRSDTGSPKDCTFGGYRRARISSQSIKRAIRHHQSFEEAVLQAGGEKGRRTKRVLNRLVELIADSDHEERAIIKVGEAILGAVKIRMADKQENDSENKTQYLLYLSESEIKGLANIASDHWDELSTIEVAAADSEKKADKKAQKKAAKDAVPKEIQKKIEEVLRKHPRLAADIALFGRMVADDKDMNIDAACQVAHAISTNQIASMEMDFFTAVDDLLPSDTAGSDMMGIVEFNSACYYRYAQINLDILLRNLPKQKDVAIAAIKGFIKAAAEATPTGMQNSMAAQNPPSYIRVFIRSEGSPWSLANAFIKPIRVTDDEDADLITKSIVKLETYLAKLQNAYGKEGFELDCKTSVETDDGITLPTLLNEVEAYLNKHLAEA